MPTLPANVSLIAPKASVQASTAHRLPRLVGWMVSATVAGALWFGLVELVRLAL